MLISEENLRLGEGHQIDPGCLLGYLTGRRLATETLIIGPGARLRAGTIIYAGSVIGEGLETGHHVVIREENAIGNNLRIWNNSTIDYGCRIGHNVRIHCNCYLPQFTTVEDDVFMAPGVTIANDLYPLQEESMQHMRGPTIKRGARLGVNVTLLPYVVVGEGAIVGAGAVVTRDVEPGTVVVGNPARVINRVENLRPITERLAEG